MAGISTSGPGAANLAGLNTPAIADPNADRIFFWDDSAGAVALLATGNSVAITLTTFDAIQDIRTTSTPEFTRLGLGVAASSAGDGVLALSQNVVAADTSIKIING